MTLKHAHAFERYDPKTDIWCCVCGASANRLGKVTDPHEGKIAMRYVRPFDISVPKDGATYTITHVGDRVRSGRELLTC